MQCPTCKREVGGNYCRYCGADLRELMPSCPSCRTKASTLDARFCYYCGAELQHFDKEASVATNSTKS